MTLEPQAGLEGFTRTNDGKLQYTVPVEGGSETDESVSIHEAQAAAIAARQAGSGTRIFAEVHVEHMKDPVPKSTGNRNKGY